MVSVGDYIRMYTTEWVFQYVYNRSSYFISYIRAVEDGLVEARITCESRYPPDTSAYGFTVYFHIMNSWDVGFPCDPSCLINPKPAPKELARWLDREFVKFKLGA